MTTDMQKSKSDTQINPLLNSTHNMKGATEHCESRRKLLIAVELALI
jgi:hypothetical protein